MSDSDRLFILAVIIVVAWVFYKVGKRVGARRERQAHEPHRRAELKTDPEKSENFSSDGTKSPPQTSGSTRFSKKRYFSEKEKKAKNDSCLIEVIFLATFPGNDSNF
jgi:hypothetical protein